MQTAKQPHHTIVLLLSSVTTMPSSQPAAESNEDPVVAQIRREFVLLLRTMTVYYLNFLSRLRDIMSGPGEFLAERVDAAREEYYTMKIYFNRRIRRLEQALRARIRLFQ